MKYKCIIFDCDGVLVDSEKISMDVLIEMTNEIGANLKADDFMEQFAGLSLQNVFAEIETIIERKLPEGFEKKYRIETFRRFGTELKPIKGITELIDGLSIPFCVASSGPREKIELNLKTTKLFDRFKDNIFSSYEIDSWKPNPEIFLYAAGQMGFQPEDCAVVEDSIAGIRAAVEGGFKVFGFVNDKRRAEFENEGAETFNGMKELELRFAEKN